MPEGGGRGWKERAQPTETAEEPGEEGDRTTSGGVTWQQIFLERNQETSAGSEKLLSFYFVLSLRLELFPEGPLQLGDGQGQGEGAVRL